MIDIPREAQEISGLEYDPKSISLLRRAVAHVSGFLVLGETAELRPKDNDQPREFTEDEMSLMIEEEILRNIF